MTQPHRNLKRLSYVAGFASLPCYAVAVVHSAAVLRIWTGLSILRSGVRPCCAIHRTCLQLSLPCECGTTGRSGARLSRAKGFQFSPSQVCFPGFKARTQPRLWRVTSVKTSVAMSVVTRWSTLTSPGQSGRAPRCYTA
jgi:hypothetical protein